MVIAVTFSEWALAVGFVVSTGGFIFTLYQFLQARADKRAEQVRRQSAEAELHEIVRRGRAPFLRASALHVNGAILEPGQSVIAESVAAGTDIGLDVANDGEEVRDISDDWADGQGIEILPWGLRHDASRASRINYRYDPKRHGVRERITIRFETLDGLKLHHVYETRHGHCELRRVDPA